MSPMNYEFGNKDAEKHTIEDFLEMIPEILDYVREDENVWFWIEVYRWSREKFDITYNTVRYLFDKYKDNNIVFSAYEEISGILEVRMLRNKEIRQNVQGLVLQSKFNYREKKDLEASVQFAKMPKVIIDDEPLDIKRETENGREEEND